MKEIIFDIIIVGLYVTPFVMVVAAATAARLLFASRLPEAAAKAMGLHRLAARFRASSRWLKPWRRRLSSKAHGLCMRTKTAFFSADAVRRAWKAAMRTLAAFAALAALATANLCWYLGEGQYVMSAKLRRGEELSFTECCSLYGVHLAATTGCLLLSPEAFLQCICMMLPFDGETYWVWSDFRKSEYVREEIRAHGGRQFTVDYPLNSVTGDKADPLRKELRYALAYESARYGIDGDGGEELRLAVKYDGYVGRYAVGPVRFSIDFRPLKYLTGRGWLHECTFVYRETLGDALGNAADALFTSGRDPRYANYTNEWNTLFFSWPLPEEEPLREGL